MTEYYANRLGYKVRTPYGPANFSGVALIGNHTVTEIKLQNGMNLRCSADHKVYDIDFNEFLVKDLRVGILLDIGDDEGSKVVFITETNTTELVYDLIDVQTLDHKYYVNGILSSNCEFLSASNDTLVNPLTLNMLKPQDELFKINESRWFEEPRANSIYAIALDPAIGNGGGDFAAIQVYDLLTMTQVAEWRSSTTSIPGQMEMMIKILYYLFQTMEADPAQLNEPEVYWSVENNSCGEAALVSIADTGEENFPGYFVHEPRKPGSRGRKGLNTTNRSKLATCSKLKSLLESQRMSIRSKPLLRELRNYVETGSSFAAKAGEHDDLVSATLLTLRILQIISHWDPELNSKLNDAIDMDAVEIEPMPFII